MPSVSLCMARRTRSANRSFGCGFTSAIAISGRYISGICRLCTRSSLAVRAEARNDVLRKPRHLGLEWLELQHEQLDACGLKIADAARDDVVGADKPRGGAAIRSNTRRLRHRLRHRGNARLDALGVLLRVDAVGIERSHGIASRLFIRVLRRAVLEHYVVDP